MQDELQEKKSESRSKSKSGGGILLRFLLGQSGHQLKNTRRVKKRLGSLEKQRSWLEKKGGSDPVSESKGYMESRGKQGEKTDRG